MSTKEFLDGLIKVGQCIVYVGGIFSGLGSWTDYKGESERSTSIHLFLLPCLPTMMDWNLKLEVRIRLSFLKFFVF